MNTLIQNVFNKVMAARVYHGNLMCLSIAQAQRNGFITYDQLTLTKSAIDNYLRGHLTLGVALMKNSLPYDTQARIAVYKDWANRPKLTR